VYLSVYVDKGIKHNRQQVWEE